MKLLFKVLAWSENVVFLPKFIWNSWVLTKMGFSFLWEACGGKVLTLDHLKKGRAIANKYFLFGEEEEMVDHLLGGVCFLT